MTGIEIEYSNLDVLWWWESSKYSYYGETTTNKRMSKLLVVKINKSHKRVEQIRLDRW